MKLVTLLALVLTACASTAPPPASPETAPVSPEPLSVVPAGLGSGQFHTIPVRLNGSALTVAVLDTGIGLALVSKTLCDRIGCAVDGEFSGQRMSGQTVTLPLTTLESLDVGGIIRRNVPAAVVDIEGFFPEPQIEAFVGLPFFEDVPFTIDAEAGELILESPATLAQRSANGTPIPVRLERHGPALDIFIPILVGDVPAEALMDTGSRSVILDMRYAQAIGMDLSAEGVRRTEGQDETGQTYQRFFATLDAVAFARAPSQVRQGMDVMFQEIIHDALVGKEFLSSFTLTYDLARERVIVAEPQR